MTLRLGSWIHLQYVVVILRTVMLLEVLILYVLELVVIYSRTLMKWSRLLIGFASLHPVDYLLVLGHLRQAFDALAPLKALFEAWKI